MARGAAAHAKFLDELLIFRELSFAFAAKHEATLSRDAFDALPAWAQATLAAHAGDARRSPRRAPAALAALESADSGDAAWDAMQRCLLRHGELHNNLRMTWGKAVLAWAPTPRLALEWLLRLNDRYALDGSDPNSYAGVLWCLGGFDGPKAVATTAVTGSIRPRSTSKHKGILARYAALVDGNYPEPRLEYGAA
ncbi:DNA photolyase, FAD-binding/Cryptochrome [Pelagophyceae sp. CCMP2097]|nr:DNA photolyase, FAD-binding/Cryptochrome [Pelagophyceae sp. CCMP2097]